MPLLHAIQRTQASAAVILRLLVGLVVFFPEGIQKLIFPAVLGAGRFARIGIPYPDAMGPFVGVVEIVCGALIIIGLLTRLAAVPLIIVMLVAIVSNKIPILLGHDVGIPPRRRHQANRVLEHDARSPHRPRDAAGADLPAHSRWRRLVA